MSAISGLTQSSRPRNKFEARLRAQAEHEKPAIETWGRRLVVIILLVWAAGLVFGYQVSLTILSLLGLFLAIVAWRSPSLALLGMAILVALDPMTRVYILTGGILRWNSFNYWMIVVILLSIPFFLRLRDRHSRLLQVFILLLALQLLISPLISSGVQDILSLLTVFGMLIYFSRALKQDQAFFWLGVVVGVLGAAGDLVYFLQKDALPYINPNAKAIFPVTALYAIVLAFPYARNYHRGRLFLILLAAVNSLWIYLSASRGNILVGLLCLIFLFLIMRSLSWATLFVSLALLVGSYLSITFLEEQLYARGRIERFFDPEYTLAERTSGRSVLAEAGWRIFQENPLGIGTGGYRVYAGQMAITEYHEKPAHSAWVKTLAENGIPGIILMVAYVSSFAVIGIRKKDPDLLLIGMLVTLVIAIAYLSTEFQNKGLLFLAAGATVMLHKEEFLENIQLGGKLKRNQKWRLRRKPDWHRNRDVHPS